MMKIISRDQMPSPTANKPFAQVEWIFEKMSEMSRSEHTAQNYRSGCTYLIRYLEQEIEPAKRLCFDINLHFDQYVLIRFKAYVEDLNKSSHYTVNILSTVRKAVNTAISNRWIDLRFALDFTLPARFRETDIRSPYTEVEMAQIMSGLAKELARSRSLLSQYKPTGRGQPLQWHGDRIARGWWGDPDNMIWYFENVLLCQPITATHPEAHKHHRFFQVAANFHGGLHELYRSWGVTAWVGQEVILPYVFQLVAETGLNPSVAMALRVDDFVEQHPLTGRPCLRYLKHRGKGEGELDLEIFEESLINLNDRQVLKIKRIWSEVIAHTSHFRDELDESKRDTLFIYQCRLARASGDVRAVDDDPKTVGNWARDFVEAHDIRAADGEPLRLFLSRFRPSLVSRLVKQGVDIFVIKAILGHRSVLTTLKYLHAHDFHPVARREVHRALQAIRNNSRKFRNKPPRIASETSGSGPAVVFATPMAFCEDVFNPPENVRKAAQIPIGKPCTIFNMCLRCPRVIVMAEHLPRLFAMRRQYVEAIEGRLSQAPHKHFIEQNLHILESLLDPNFSDWTSEELEEAERRSYLIDVQLDTTAFRGVGYA